MRRAWILPLGFALFGCTSRPHTCRLDPRYGATQDDHVRGIPDAIVERDAELVRTESPRARHCQVLIEPSFSIPHAVWYTYGDSDLATVVVRFERPSGNQERTAEIDEGTARRLDGLCERFLRDPPECERSGLDGTFFHVAHYVARSSYLMRTFWSPRDESIDASFVAMIGALRDYVLVPDAMRSVKWHDVQRSALMLERSLMRGHPEPEAELCPERTP